MKSIRKQKHITFININDGSSPSDLQVVVDTQLVRYVHMLMYCMCIYVVMHYSPDINYGSSIEAQGDIMQSTHPKQPVELQTSHVTLLGECNTEVCVYTLILSSITFTNVYLYTCINSLYNSWCSFLYNHV